MVDTHSTADREQWLNGWHRTGPTVLVVSSVCCAGCGKPLGSATIAIPDNWQPPERKPNYPFGGADCPVCNGLTKESILPTLTLVELRREIAERKKR